MCSCSLFFRCRSFSPWWQLAFPLFLTAAMTFLCFSSNEIGLLWSFISRSSSFSVIQTLILRRKKESAFVVVFIFKRPGSYAIYPETRGWLKCKISSRLIWRTPYQQGYQKPTGIFYCMSTRTKWRHDQWRRPWCIVIGTKFFTLKACLRFKW